MDTCMHGGGDHASASNLPSPWLKIGSDRRYSFCVLLKTDLLLLLSLLSPTIGSSSRAIFFSPRIFSVSLWAVPGSEREHSAHRSRITADITTGGLQRRPYRQCGLCSSDQHRPLGLARFPTPSPAPVFWGS